MNSQIDSPDIQLAQIAQLPQTAESTRSAQKEKKKAADTPKTPGAPKMAEPKIIVCHLSSVHIYFDTRIFYKECRSLAEEGYDVRLVARKKDGEPVTTDNVHVIPFHEYTNRFKRILFSPFRMYRTAMRQKARVYHFHDPELLPVGIMLKLSGKKVIYDVHEDYSKQLLYKYWLKSSFLKKVLARCFRLFERFAVMFFDRIAAATDDITGRFPARKTFTLRNLPILKTIRDAELPQVEKTGPVIIYAGVLGRVRGLREIIEAMTHVKTDAELWLLGPWENESFRAECESLDGWKYVKYMGMKKPHEVYGYMKSADIGLSLLYPIRNYLTSLPVKSFEYLACSVPMIMSDFEYWQDIFGGCALFTDPKSPETIGKRINELLENKEERNRLKQAGEALVSENYSWEAEKVRLTDAYNELTRRKTKS